MSELASEPECDRCDSREHDVDDCPQCLDCGYEHDLQLRCDHPDLDPNVDDYHKRLRGE